MIIAVIFFLIVVNVFLDPDVYKDSWDKIKNMFSLPERDPLPWQSGNLTSRKSAFDVFGKFRDNLLKTAGATDKPLCFGAFDAFPNEFFQNKYAIEFTQDGSNIKMQVIQTTFSNEDQSQGTKYITRSVGQPEYIDNSKLCVIYDQGLKNFYEQVLFNERDINNKPIQSIEDKNYEYFVHRILIVSGNDGPEIHFSKDASGNMDEKSFKLAEDRKHYFIFKNKNSLCFFPSRADGHGDCTNYATSMSSLGGVIDRDCLDYDDNDKNGLPFLLSHRLSSHVCSTYEFNELI